MTGAARVSADSRVVVVGYGLHGQAVAGALVRRGLHVTVVDDGPSDAALRHAEDLGLTITTAPEPDELRTVLASATHLVPTPGLPEHHLAFAFADELELPVIGEFDLAASWDDRPCVAITGTNGKTTVTTMVTEMLVADGRTAVMSGNMELPLVVAIDDPATDIFVVEASSFRLGHSSTFRPIVGTWLNFEPDHLDVHPSLDAYEAAKARIWANLDADDIAIASASDDTVLRNLPGRPTDRTFGGSDGDARVVDGMIVVHDRPIVAIDELARSLPHDVDNALAAALTAIEAGASDAAVGAVLRSFSGLPHRVQLVGEAAGVRWYNDSKATTPHAVLAGVGGFDHVVLIAGGRNKGVDLSPLAELAPRLRGVVAIGDDAAEIEAVFAELAPVTIAGSMSAAVDAAAAFAVDGDAVVLSPACTSYDWYPNYGARGDDFARIVAERIGALAR